MYSVVDTQPLQLILSVGSFRKDSHWKSIYTFEETAKKLAKKMFDKVENVADNYFLEI